MPDLTIRELLDKASHPLLSYEFFPPKTAKGMHRLWDTAARLEDSTPDFVTCTWGAGGSTREMTLDVCEALRTTGFDVVMPHLTCVGLSRGEVGEIAEEIYDKGFRNIMTLRGDPPQGESSFTPPQDGLSHASELVELLKNKHADFCCGVAGYPEKHVEASSLDEDLRNLKKKVDAGADFITTQLFFDNALYYRFVEQCGDLNIDLPILPGLLPAMSLKQIERFTSMCGATFPTDLEQSLEREGAEGPAAEQVGIQWTADQVDDLLDHKVPGVHLYVLNRSNVALAPEIKLRFERVRGT